MTQIDIQAPDAPSLRELLDRAVAGEDIVLLRDGKPAARLTAQGVEPAQQTLAGQRPLGLYAGQVWISEDFDELPGDIAAAFRGEKP
jgi:antitoxin (DNA-binding transcriptional repressor) of toxin-antitoxin stability system